VTDQCLYRLQGTDGGPPYIGISDDWTRRLRQHWLDKPWAGEILGVALETYGDRPEVLAVRQPCWEFSAG
jgi:hypothetical protein